MSFTSLCFYSDDDVLLASKLAVDRRCSLIFHSSCLFRRRFQESRRGGGDLGASQTDDSQVHRVTKVFRNRNPPSAPDWKGLSWSADDVHWTHRLPCVDRSSRGACLWRYARRRGEGLRRSERKSPFTLKAERQPGEGHSIPAQKSTKLKAL